MVNVVESDKLSAAPLSTAGQHMPAAASVKGYSVLTLRKCQHPANSDRHVCGYMFDEMVSLILTCKTWWTLSGKPVGVVLASAVRQASPEGNGRHISDEFGTPQQDDCPRRQLDRGASQMTAPIPVAADLENWSKHPWTDGLQVDALPDLETLCVRTRNSTYEITVLSGRTAEVIVRGGQFFPEYTPVRVAGSSLGRSFLKVHGIYLGFSMELHHDGQTIVTTEVQSIRRMTNDQIQ
jgi:hypothetical protein